MKKTSLPVMIAVLISAWTLLIPWFFTQMLSSMMTDLYFQYFIIMVYFGAGLVASLISWVAVVQKKPRLFFSAGIMTMIPVLYYSKSLPILVLILGLGTLSVSIGLILRPKPIFDFSLDLRGLTNIVYILILIGEPFLFKALNAYFALNFEAEFEMRIRLLLPNLITAPILATLGYAFRESSFTGFSVAVAFITALFFSNFSWLPSVGILIAFIGIGAMIMNRMKTKP